MFPFQVVDIGPYHHKDKGKGKRLVEDLKNFKPDVLMLGWCWSQNSDVTLWLWMYFPYMLLHHDLKVITGRKENWDDSPLSIRGPSTGSLEVKRQNLIKFKWQNLIKFKWKLSKLLVNNFSRLYL